MVRVIRLSVIGIRLMAPWVWRAIGAVFMLIALAVTALWVGVPKAAGHFANKWVDHAVQSGLPTMYDRYLYYLIWTLALLPILAGWVFFAFITVYAVMALLAQMGLV